MAQLDDLLGTSPADFKTKEELVEYVSQLRKRHQVGAALASLERSAPKKSAGTKKAPVINPLVEAFLRDSAQDGQTAADTLMSLLDD